MTPYVMNVLMRWKKEEKMANDAVVLWGLLLVYGLPIVTVAYWMEKMMHKGGGEDERTV